ncbi:MAG: Uma2 family endonuclease [Chloroflexota bacterium]
MLRLFATSFDLGVVLGAPFPVRLQPNRVRRRGSGREPDILFIARDHLDRIRDNYLDGPADLAVEIVSPSGRHRDGVEKYAEYEAAGVREYWMIDPDRQRPEFHRLDARGRYQLVPLEDGGIFRSEVVRGFWLRVDWLWQDPLPEIEALRALAVLPSAREG